MTEMNLKDFHGLTHGGMEHVVRRIVDDSIEPNYTELELFNVVKARKQYCINIVVYLFTLIENESGLAELNQKRREWKKAL